MTGKDFSNELGIHRNELTQTLVELEAVLAMHHELIDFINRQSESFTFSNRVDQNNYTTISNFVRAHNAALKGTQKSLEENVEKSRQLLKNYTDSKIK